MKKHYSSKKSFSFLVLLTIFALTIFSSSASALTISSEALQAPARANKISPQVQQAIQAMGQIQQQSVIVTLNSQANLSQILETNRNIRLNRVELALQNMANTTQGRIRALLTTRQSEGKVSEYESYWIFNGLSVTATPDVIQELAALPEVSTITLDATIQAPEYTETSAPPEMNLDVIKAPALWQLGYQGQGIVVANMDTGVDLNHPDLVNQWRGGTNSWYDPYGQHPTTPTDLSGHGTWTMGVMVGGDSGGTTVGVAPAAQWIAVKIFNDSGSATISGIHAGFQWLLDPDGNPATADAPHVVNNSWSFPNPGCNLEFNPDLQALAAAGIVPVFAAGNYGPNSSTSVSPSNNPWAFAVGAINNTDTIYYSSSRGPSTCDETQMIYPEVVAPGVDIHTTDLNGYYTTATGTSLASPHVAGGLALLLNAFPNTSAADQESALLSSAVDLGAAGPDNDFGYGRIDLLGAYNWIQNNAPTPTPPPVATNLALNHAVTVSSIQDGSHSGQQAVDGDIATYWQSKQIKGKGGPSTEWITVDLGGSASITEVVLKWDSYYATNYAIQTSDDGSAWANIFTTTTGNGGDDSITLVIGSARYVRMESTAWSDAKVRNWLREIEIYGTISEPAPTETPTPPPNGGTVHIGNLDGSSSLKGGSRWDASVLITVHDGNENIISGATVTGRWSTGGSGSCVTDDLGQCSLAKNSLKASQQSITFTVDGISLSGYEYQSSANHDLDGDSDGTDIIIAQP